MGILALIGLGSNLGDREAILNTAVAALSVTPGIELRKVSSFHETNPIGGPEGQGAFLNAAVALETTLSPSELHRRLIEIEQDAGRVRVVRWGERTLDLDILLFGDEVIDTPELTVPHLRMCVRRFVLAPLCEIAPDAVDPFTGMTIKELLAWIDRRPGYVAIPRFWITELHGSLPWNYDKSLPQPESVEIQVAKKLEAIALCSAPYDRFNGMELYCAEEFHSEEPGFVDAVLTRQAVGDLQQSARELYAKRWPVERLGDRWIVTDYWLREAYMKAKDRFVDSEALWKSFDWVTSCCLAQALSPTFVAITGPDADRPLAEWVKMRNGWSEGGNPPTWSRSPLLLVRVPIPDATDYHEFIRQWADLRTWSDGTEEKVEKMQNEHEERLRRLCFLAEDYDRSIANEILAACEASRIRSTIVVNLEKD